MLYSKYKKEAIKECQENASRYDEIHAELLELCEKHYKQQIRADMLIEQVLKFINTISNSPKEMDVEISKIITQNEKFKTAEELAEENLNSLKTSLGVGAAAAFGAKAASSIASAVAKKSSKDVLMTFGSSSASTAVSTLSGTAGMSTGLIGSTVGTSAGILETAGSGTALALVGGGACFAGGTEVAAAETILTLIGPIGWGIAGISFVATGATIGIKNKKTGNEAKNISENILKASQMLLKKKTIVDDHSTKMIKLYVKISKELDKLSVYRGADYLTLPNEVKLELGTFVNNVQSYAELINEEL